MTTLEAVRSVPYFNYSQAFADQGEAYSEIFQNIMGRGAFIQQSDLAKFESDLANYLPVRYAYGVGNATDGLIMIWRAIGLEPGDEVIFPSHTMVASPASVHFAGGTPVPVDIGSDGLLDPECIVDAITSRTRAIMPVQLNGRTCQMDRIKAIAEQYGLLIVEDAAQGLGSKYKGQHAGTFGVGAAFSFYPAKILGCMGDGGAVVTQNERIAHRLSLLRDHGRNESGEVEMWGLNSRLDNLQAAILEYQFQNYDRIIKRRREIAQTYQNQLGDLNELQLPPAPNSDPYHFDVYQNYELQADRRNDLREYLKKNGVGTLLPWGGKAVHQYEGLGLKASLPNTERFFERCLMLPMNMTLTDDEVQYVCDTVRAFYRG